MSDATIQSALIVSDYLVVDLSDRQLWTPLDWYPRLVKATGPERVNIQIIGAGHGLHWPDLDEDLSLAGMLAGERSRAQ